MIEKTKFRQNHSRNDKNAKFRMTCRQLFKTQSTVYTIDYSYHPSSVLKTSISNTGHSAILATVTPKRNPLFQTNSRTGL